MSELSNFCHNIKTISLWIFPKVSDRCPGIFLFNTYQHCKMIASSEVEHGWRVPKVTKITSEGFQRYLMNLMKYGNQRFSINYVPPYLQGASAVLTPLPKKRLKITFWVIFEGWKILRWGVSILLTHPVGSMYIHYPTAVKLS